MREEIRISKICVFKQHQILTTLSLPREVGPLGTEMRKWRAIADTEHPRSVPRFFPYIRLSISGACHFPKRETLTNHQLVHWPIPDMLGGRGGQPSGGPLPNTPSAESLRGSKNPSPGPTAFSGVFK